MTGNAHERSCVLCEILFLCYFEFIRRTYTFNDRRYGHYQPNGYGNQYPGQKHPNQYPQGVPLGEDKFKYDPVC